VIGVLGTRATVRQAYVDDLAARFAGDCRVIRHGSAELVELAEARLRGETPSSDPSRRCWTGCSGSRGARRSDVIVNACTHFPAGRGGTDG
jgi:glutamate racemase